MSNNLFLFLKAEKKKKKVPTLCKLPLPVLLGSFNSFIEMRMTVTLMGPELQHEKALHPVNCKNLINEDR